MSYKDGWALALIKTKSQNPLIPQIPVQTIYPVRYKIKDTFKV